LADWGKAIAHAGLGITIFGVSGITAWQVEDIRVLEIGQSAEVAGFTITLEAVEDRRGPNYLTTMADVTLSKQGNPIAMLHPERRYYPVAEMPTTEAGIDSGLWRDVYVVVGDAQAEGGYAVRSFIKPLANWIWTGAIIMALGGFLSLFDRRYRLAPGAVRDPGPEAPS
jgi:cytochrome c-type biogenesis protein CcmF